MSDFDLQADGNSLGLFVANGELFDFDEASYQYPDVSAAPQEESFDNPFDNPFDDPSDDDDGLLGEAVSSINDVGDEELGEEEDGVMRASGVLSWKIEHSTGDHKLKGMQNVSSYLAIASDIT